MDLIQLGARVKPLSYGCKIKITVNNKFHICNIIKASLTSKEYKYIKDYFNLIIDREEIEEDGTVHFYVTSNALERYVLEKENKWYESKDSRLLWWRYRNDNKI